jgi:hypothetical protein
MKNPLPSLPCHRPAGAPLLLLAAFLLLSLGWHLYLSADLLWQSSIPQRALTLLRWRLLDQFTGWFALLVLFAGENIDSANPPSRLLRIILPTLLALGIASNGYSLASAMGATAPAGMEKYVELVTAGLLALTAALLVFRQLFALAGAIGERAGFTIDQLWRLVTIQWILVWVAAEVFLRIKFRNAGGVSADERARSMLFALPAFGVLPNLMMSAGIRWQSYKIALLPQAQTLAEKVRPRAWIVAMIALNLGSVCLIASDFFHAWLSVLGAIGFGFAIVMYLLGFSSDSRRGAGKMILTSFVLLLLGVLLAASERIRAGQQITILREFSAGWRFLLSPAAPIVWTLGIAASAIGGFIPENLQGRAATTAAFVLLTLGGLLTALFFILAASSGNSLDREWLGWIGLGTILMWVGLLIACAVALRGWRIRAAFQK